MPSVDVVVVAYNSRDCLATCVEPLVGMHSVSIIVVDNACPERSFEVVETVAGVRVIHTGRNGGFACGSNAGWGAGDSEFVLFLNPDARLDADSLTQMAQVLEGDSHAAVVGPRTYRTDGSLAWSIRRFPSLRSTYARAFFIHRLVPRAAWVDEVVRDPGAYARRRSVAWLPGTCLLARRTALEAVGGFDESFFMYVEDMDLCRKVGEAGLDVVYCPDAVCVHEGGQSLSRTHLLPILAASRLRYAKHHSGGPMRGILQQIGLVIGEALQTVVGQGELGHRREHLRALGVILRGDEGYRLPASAGTEDRGVTDRQRMPEVARNDDSGLLHGLQRHFVTFLQVWVLLALLAIVGNEIVEHSVWDERQLANGDILSAALVVLTTFAASYFIGCRQRSQFVTFRAELTPLTPPDDA